MSAFQTNFKIKRQFFMIIAKLNNKYFYIMVFLISLPSALYSCSRHGINEAYKEKIENIKNEYHTFQNDNIRINVMTKDKFMAAVFDNNGTFIINNSSNKIFKLGKTNWDVIGIDKKYWDDRFQYSSHSRSLILERMYQQRKLSCFVKIPNIDIYEPITIEGIFIANCTIAKPIALNKFANINEYITTDVIKLIIYPKDKSLFIIKERGLPNDYSIFDSGALMIISIFTALISFVCFVVKY